MGNLLWILGKRRTVFLFWDGIWRKVWSFLDASCFYYRYLGYKNEQRSQWTWHLRGSLSQFGLNIKPTGVMLRETTACFSITSQYVVASSGFQGKLHGVFTPNDPSWIAINFSDICYIYTKTPRQMSRCSLIICSGDPYPTAAASEEDQHIVPVRTHYAGISDIVLKF